MLRSNLMGVMMTGAFLSPALAHTGVVQHGHAHGAEAATASLIPYASGFTLATAALHVTGIELGLFAESSIGKFALRAMGGLAAASGLALMAG